jgi:hypothetical protein
VADELDDKGNVKTRKVYHWKQDNLSDWTAYNTPNFNIDTIGNGCLYIDQLLGAASSTTPQLKYIAKDDVDLNTESIPSKTIACSLDLSIVDHHSYAAGIVLHSKTGAQSILFGVYTGRVVPGGFSGRYDMVIRFYNSDTSQNSEILMHSLVTTGKNIQLAVKRIDATRTQFFYSTDGSNWNYVGILQVNSAINGDSDPLGLASTYGTGNFSQPGTGFNDLDRIGIGYDWEGSIGSGYPWAADPRYGNVVFDWIAHS